MSNDFRTCAQTLCGPVALFLFSPMKWRWHMTMFVKRVQYIYKDVDWGTFPPTNSIVTVVQKGAVQ